MTGIVYVLLWEIGVERIPKQELAYNVDPGEEEKKILPPLLPRDTHLVYVTF